MVAQAEHITYFNSDNRGLNAGTRQAERSVRRVDSAGNRLIRTFRQINTVAFGLGTGFGLVQLTRGLGALTRADDNVRSITNLLRSVGQQDRLDNAIAISNATFADLSGTGTLVGRIAASTEDVGRAWEEVQTVVEAVNNSYRIGGVLTREQRASSIQLSQALASGRFGGDERRAVLEGNPRLARAIAAGAGIPFGQIREAPLDATIVFDAILNQAQQLNTEAANLETTWGQAGNILNTGLTLAGAQSARILDNAIGLRDLIQDLGFNLQLGSGFAGQQTQLQGLQRQLETEQRIAENYRAIGIPFLINYSDDRVRDIQERIRAIETAINQQRNQAVPLAEAPSQAGFATLAQGTVDATNAANDFATEVAVLANQQLPKVAERFAEEDRRIQREFDALIRNATQPLNRFPGEVLQLIEDARRQIQQGPEFTVGGRRFGDPNFLRSFIQNQGRRTGDLFGPEGQQLLEDARRQIRQGPEFAIGGRRFGDPDFEPDPTFLQMTATSFFGNLNSALLQAVTSGNFDNIGEAFFASLTGALLGSVLELASNAALSALGVPGFARGGQFGPGPMIVGEEGPELLVPRTSGVIVPNDRLGGLGGGDNYRIVIDALSDDALTQRIIALAPDLLRLARNQ